MNYPAKLWIHGWSGRMGQEIAALVKLSDYWELTGGSGSKGIYGKSGEILEPNLGLLPKFAKEADLILDFSSADGNSQLYDILRSQEKLIEKAVLVGSTGLTEDSINKWKSLAVEKSLRILFAPNTSLGILLTLKLAQQLTSILSRDDFDIELLESHHRDKKDAPSGTGLFLARNLQSQDHQNRLVYGRQNQRQVGEIGIASLRGGSIFGEHEIRFLGQHEEITVSHKALSREVFAKGALILGRWIMSKPQQTVWDLQDISIEELLAVSGTGSQSRTS